MAEKMPTSRTDGAVRNYGAKKYARGYAAGLNAALHTVKIAHKTHSSGTRPRVILKKMAFDLQDQIDKVKKALRNYKDEANLTD